MGSPHNFYFSQQKRFYWFRRQSWIDYKSNKLTSLKFGDYFESLKYDSGFTDYLLSYLSRL